MGLSRRAAVTPEGVSRGSMGPFETQATDASEHSLLNLSEFRRTRCGRRQPAALRPQTNQRGRVSAAAKSYLWAADFHSHFEIRTDLCVALEIRIPFGINMHPLNILPRGGCRLTSYQHIASASSECRVTGCE